MNSSEQVYTGFWTNWAHGRVVGATLTLRNGAYLVAFLALFVRIVGGHFWRLLCYIMFHYLPSQPDAGDSSLKQQKAILRNTYSPTTSSMRFITIARRSSKAPFKSSTSYALALTALLNAVGFMLAGLFSSAVTQRASSVLLRPIVCGSWKDLTPSSANRWNDEDIIRSVDLASMSRQNLITSSRLYRTCNESSSLLENCFALGDWPISPSSRHVPCPFGSNLCSVKDAVSLDTGYLNSQVHLGINAPEGDSIDFRRMATCAPLHTRGFSSEEVSQDGQNVTGYYYGENLKLDMNSTYSYIDSAQPKVSRGTTVEKWSYELDVEAAAFLDSTDNASLEASSSFVPISQLRKPNSTVVLAFLVKRSKYLSPVLDPWFRAESQEPLSLTITPSSARKINVFTAKADPISVLACFEQVELCNSNKPSRPCISIPITHKLIDFINVLELTDKQTGTAERIFQSLTRSALFQTIWSLGSQGLLASSTIQVILPSPALPKNQWELEVFNWFGTSLAALQLLIIQDITGYSNPDFNRYVTTHSARDEWMCDSQVVHRSDFASFSVLGLCIILVLGSFIILLSESVYHILPLVRSRSKAIQHGKEEWRVFDILELATTLRSANLNQSTSNHDSHDASGKPIMQIQSCRVDHPETLK